MNRLFVSDLHLDADTSELNVAFFDLLVRERLRCEEIYVLGDLTDVWVGDDDDSVFARELAAAFRAAADYCRVYIMHGNRDFLIGQQFCRAAGLELVDDPHIISVGDRRAVLCHGDSLCTDDARYQALRGVLRSPVWQADMLARSLIERRQIADELRAQSRSANANKPANIMDVADAAVTDLARSSGADLLIHGHTHRPAIHTLTVDGRTLTRYVLGQWQRCGWLLRARDAHIALECFVTGQQR